MNIQLGIGSVLAGAAIAAVALLSSSAAPQEAEQASDGEKQPKAVAIEYLEIVTPEVDATCANLEKVHGVTFSKPVPEFGNARTAALRGGGRIGVRAPMRATEDPVVRPYVLVEDIDAATQTAEEGGGQIAIMPLEIPEQGMFSIYLQGGIEHGLWMN
jgi:predicted enzyme related to lactoylglutathione lyase